MSFIRRWINRNQIMATDEYAKSRHAFLLQGATSISMMSLAGGAFIAGFGQLLGANQEIIGILGGIPALAASVQFFAPAIFERMTRRKPTITRLVMFSRSGFCLLFLLPWLLPLAWMRVAVFGLLLAMGYGGANIIAPPVFHWIARIVPENQLGRYISQREMVMYTAVGIVSVAVGYMMDALRHVGKESVGFFIIAGLIVILAVMDSTCYHVAQEPELPPTRRLLSFRKYVLLPFRNRRFKKILILNVLWNIGVWLAQPFFYVYMVTELRLPYLFILGLGLLANAARVISARFWGRLVEIKSFEYLMKLGLGLMCVANLLWALVNPANMVPVIILINILTGISFGAISVSMFNLQHNYSPTALKTAYLAANGAIGGVFGFPGTILGSLILGWLGKDGFSLGAIHIGGMQLIFLLSVLLLALNVLYVHLRIKPCVKSDTNVTQA